MFFAYSISTLGSSTRKAYHFHLKVLLQHYLRSPFRNYQDKQITQPYSGIEGILRRSQEIVYKEKIDKKSYKGFNPIDSPEHRSCFSAHPPLHSLKKFFYRSFFFMAD